MADHLGAENCRALRGPQAYISIYSGGFSEHGFAKRVAGKSSKVVIVIAKRKNISVPQSRNFLGISNKIASEQGLGLPTAANRSPGSEARANGPLGLGLTPYFRSLRGGSYESTLAPQKEHIHNSVGTRILRTKPKKPRTIVYWAFEIEIVGPRYRTKTVRHKMRKILLRKLKAIEDAATLAATAKLPAGFRIRTT